MAMLILRVYWEKDNFLQLLIILFLFFTMVVRLVGCTLYSVSGLVNQVYPSAYEPAVVLCIPVLPIGKQTSFPPHIQWENVRDFSVKKVFDLKVCFKFMQVCCQSWTAFFYKYVYLINFLSFFSPSCWCMNVNL